MMNILQPYPQGISLRKWEGRGSPSHFRREKPQGWGWRILITHFQMRDCLSPPAAPIKSSYIFKMKKERNLSIHGQLSFSFRGLNKKALSKAVHWEKLKGAQALNLWNPVCPAYDLYKKSKDFLVAQEQKLVATGHQALLEPGLKITAGQWTMSSLIVDLTGQTLILPVILTGHFWKQTF